MKADQSLLRQISQLMYCNPFSPRRLEIEQEILGSDFTQETAVAWSRQTMQREPDRPNVTAIANIASSLVERINQDAESKSNLPHDARQHYWDVATYVLLYKHVTPHPTQELYANPTSQLLKQVWQAFRADFKRLIDTPELATVNPHSPEHLFACLCQVHRAFTNIYDNILGNSLPIARLRERVWQSIFTFDARRYYRSLHDRMHLLSTMITGPSGTGKELVARAIGLSQYLAFDSKTCSFKNCSEESFHAINLSALSPTLIESELFGHRKGAFTGAVSDRKGWLETCPQHGCVFLDELGEIDLALQVKLLRVIQNRTFTRLGETQERPFIGKFVSATNRNLKQAIEERRFREDLYFRLCSDQIETPSLREQLDDRPADLTDLVLAIASRLIPNESEEFSREATEWIQQKLGENYPWKGNIRELEQCVRSLLVRKEYIPVWADEASAITGNDVKLPGWIQRAADRTLSAEELVAAYCHWVHQETQNYEHAARKIGLDRRTIKAKVTAFQK
ncbi:MAG: sigma 54-interacting transcriptional regulator [Pirellulaceae bacterium]